MNRTMQANKHRKKPGKIRLISVLLSCILLIGLATPVLGAEIDAETEEAIRTLIAEEYYLVLDEVVDVKNDDLFVVLAALDTYSEYLTREAYESFDDNVEGAFGGIGVQITTTDRGVVAEGVLPDSPAEKAGIKIGDLFVSVDGVDIRDLVQKDLVALLRGEPGSSVVVGMEREGETEELLFVLTREIIDISGKTVTLSEDGVAYFAFNTFSSDTGGWFLGNLIKLEREGMKGVVLDLRSNPGGRLTAALGMSSAILENGETLAKIYSQDELVNQYHSTTKGFHIPVVMLGNHNSASASEFVMVALKDNQKGLLVGETTYGKGVIQTAFILPNNDVLKLTTAEYKGPADTPIQGVGIVPDYPVADVPELEGEEVFDEQLAAAMSLVRQQIRYWGPKELTFLSESKEAYVGLEGQMMEQATRIMEGTFYVPLRDAANLLNLDVQFADGQIQVQGFEKELTFTPFSRIVVGKEQTVEMPKPLIMEQGRTYVPLRSLGEMLGYHVLYDAATKEVSIQK